jgi:hypothetical protein
MDAPELRVVQPAELGPVKKLPEVGGCIIIMSEWQHECDV